MLHRYQVPQNIEILSQIQNIKFLKIQLQNMHQKHVNSFNLYRLRYCEHKKRYLYVKCKDCRWRLDYRYNQDEEVYKLIRFENIHSHQYVCNLKSEAISNFFKSLPYQMERKTARHLLQRQLGLSLTSFYYHFNKYKNPFNTVLQLYNFLDSNQYEIITDPYQQNPIKPPAFSMFVSPLMKQNFERYGRQQFVSYDLTFNLIKELHSSEKSYKIGMFVGLSCSRRIVPFALTILISQTKESYYQLLKNFFLVMKDQPKTIITDEAAAIKSCLSEMKIEKQFSGYHALDQFHILRNIRSKLIQKSHLSYFSRLIKCEDSKIFNRYVQQIRHYFNEHDEKILNKFIQQSHLYCLGQLPFQAFVGCSVSDGSNEKLHDLIKRQIPISKDYIYVTNTILKLLEQIGSKCNQIVPSKILIQNFYQFSQFRWLRQNFDKRIIQVILSNLKISFFLHIHQTQDKKIIKIEQSRNLENKQMQQKEIYEMYLNQEGIWMCQCGYYQKTGIICRHQLKVIIFKQEKIGPYINSRWKYGINTAQKIQKKLARSRSTRKKRQ